jgi:hypothetical protein
MSTSFQTLTGTLNFSAASASSVSIALGADAANLFSGQLYISASSAAVNQTATLTFYNNPAMLSNQVIYLATVPLVYNYTSSSVSSGATSANLTSALSLSTYELVRFIDGNAENQRISSISGNVINFYNPTVNAHSSSTPVASVIEFAGFDLGDLSGGQSIYASLSFAGGTQTITCTLNLQTLACVAGTGTSGQVAVFNADDSVTSYSGLTATSGGVLTASSLSASSVSASTVTAGTLNISPIAAAYYCSGNGTTNGTTPINYDTKLYDTNNAVTTGVGSWKFTAPITGYYRVTTYIDTASAVNGTLLYLDKNGSHFSTSFGMIYAAGYGLGSQTISLNSGDTIRVTFSSTQTWEGGGYGSSSNPCAIYIELVR